jgi:hypothetical protein
MYEIYPTIPAIMELGIINVPNPDGNISRKNGLANVDKKVSKIICPILAPLVIPINNKKSKTRPTKVL